MKRRRAHCVRGDKPRPLPALRCRYALLREFFYFRRGIPQQNARSARGFDVARRSRAGRQAERASASWLGCSVWREPFISI
ncbi:hypothetical protein IE982_06480 [Enterobacter hormaechei]|nr:hypothetical protein AN697_18365 [Enterobacter cloacae subsp. cloacae]MBD3698517.1 hypothetical protein [Enterobacter hormaechei]